MCSSIRQNTWRQQGKFMYIQTMFLQNETRQNVNLFSVPRMFWLRSVQKSLINTNQASGNLEVSLQENDVACMISFQRKKGNEIEMMGSFCSLTMTGDCRRYASDTNVLQILASFLLALAGVLSVAVESSLCNQPRFSINVLPHSYPQSNFFSMNKNKSLPFLC